MASLVWAASDYSYNIPCRKHHWSTSAASHLAKSQKQLHQSWSAFWSKRLVSKIDQYPLPTHNGTSLNGSAQVNDCQPYRYSHQNNFPKLNSYQVTKRLKTTLQNSSSSPVTPPCYNLPYRLSTQQIVTKNDLTKETTLNNQCTPSTHAMLSRQRWNVTSSLALSRTTNSVCY